jgi:excisionase family DNA binding protein
MSQYSEIRNPKSSPSVAEPPPRTGEIPKKEIMTPREAADYLSIHVRTIYRLAKHGEIPGRKVGGSWRFKKEALDDWLSWKDNPSQKEKA